MECERIVMPFANKEDERVYRKKYYKLHKEKIKESASNHYYNNKEHHKKQYKEYRGTDAGKETVRLGRKNEKLERLKSAEQAIDKNIHYSKWSNVEDMQLLELKENKTSWKKIAETLNRSIKGAEARYYKLIQQ